jgi:hypothetical protein
LFVRWVALWAVARWEVALWVVARWEAAPWVVARWEAALWVVAEEVTRRAVARTRTAPMAARQMALGTGARTAFGAL